MKNSSASGSEPFWKGFVPGMLVLTAVLAFLFRDSFKEGVVLFANDGPLGVLKSQALAVPEVLTGFWMDLNWLGINGSAAASSFTYLVLWALGPVGFAKFYAPITLLILGASAWIFFRTLKLSPGLCTVAALAAALNMNFFSNTCWGLGTRSLTLAAAFLALAALMTRRAGNRWLNAALAGFCVGWGVIEGADNGAIFSLFIAAFVVFQAWIEETTMAKRVTSALRLALVGVFAAFIAAQVMMTLLGIASKGSSGGAGETRSPEDQWSFATQWSLPKIETLRVMIPGLYGYRMDTEGGGEYWGRVGEYPQMPEAGRRSSGAGEYAGVLVVLVAFWALFQSLRRAGSAGQVFSDTERNYIRFWAVLALLATLFAWGRHAPFYQLVYALPYFKTIRNPMKFMHPAHMILMILFGYGLLGISRRYLQTATAQAAGLSARFKGWWVKATPFERRWTAGAILAGAVSVLAYLGYSGAKDSLTKHLTEIGFNDPSRAAMIARFSIGEVGLFVIFLLVSVAIVILIQIGFFAGTRSRWAVVVLGIVLTLDLARADAPWIIHYDYRAKYQSNAILDILREKPQEARVVAPSFLTDRIASFHPPGKSLAYLFPSIYGGEWVQHHFQYYNIQSLDIAQDPRPPADKSAYLKALGPNIGRYWELANTRYVFGMAGFLDALNVQTDKGSNRFRVRATFDLAPKSGITSPSKLEDLTAVPATNGALALFEFTGALPRAKLFSQWEVIADQDALLKKLADPAFNPAQSVLVADSIPAAAPGTNTDAGTVEFTSYAPKQIELHANASAPSVLLLNDKFDPTWKVWVDGKPADLLRCNFLMRGVALTPGQHTIKMRFEPSLAGLKVTVVAAVVGLVLCGLLFVVHPPAEAEAVETPARPAIPPKKPAK